MALTGFSVATAAGISDRLLSLVFTVTVVLVLAVAVWSAFCAWAEIRRFVTLAVCALAWQVVADVAWYVAYEQDSGGIPHLGWWTPALYIALVLALAAVWTGVRDILRPCDRLLRNAFLDYSIVVVAAASVAILIADPRSTSALGALASLDTIARTLLCLLVVVLFASALLGRWRSLPLPVGLFALALLCDACGALVETYSTAHGGYTSDRWTSLVWFIALVFLLFGALAVIAGVERPVRLARNALPGVSATPLVAVVLAAWTAAGAVAVYGAVNSDQPALFAGVVAIVWIGAAGLLRLVSALGETRTAYLRLNDALFGLEQEHERAEGLVAQLAQRNVELTAVHSMLGPLLDMANERTDGALRAQLEEIADDLVAWLPFRHPE